MSLAMAKTVVMDSDVEMQDASTLPYQPVSLAGEVMPEATATVLRFPAACWNSYEAPNCKKRKAEGEVRRTVKKVKVPTDNRNVNDVKTLPTYGFELANFTAEELEKMEMGFEFPYPSLYKSKQSSQHEQVPKATTFTDNVRSYQQVYQSESGWNSKMWNPVWGTAEYITLNEKYDEYFIKHHPSIATFPGEPQGDLDNAIEPLVGRENWLLDGFVQNPDLLWSRMEAALRMTSMFLTTPQVMNAWAPLVQGKEVGHRGSETVFLSYDDKERKDDLVNAIDIIGKAFKALAGKVKFVFVVYSKFEGTGEEFGPTHGVHYAPGDKFVDEVFVRGDPLELERHEDAHKIFLNGAYSEFFQQDLTRVSASQYARTLFTFGTTIVHELSHVLYWHLNRERLCKVGDYLEPLLFEDESAGEIGSSIERRLFGYNWTAAIHPEKGVDTESVQFLGEWDNGVPVKLPKSHLVCYIEPHWMHSFLTKARWEQMVETPSTLSSGAKWPNFRFFLARKNLMAKDMSKVKWDIVEPAWEVPMVGNETGPNGQPVGCLTELQVYAEYEAAVDRDKKSLQTRRAAARNMRNAADRRQKGSTTSSRRVTRCSASSSSKRSSRSKTQSCVA
ncbi:uncharacterized protein N0V89_008178 [Didymosphaeria variabile]|uniref:Uncharacterized protein n=1 Tax=Didymosphaeria variabile TaxID=1932322 RepID=A0A9W8XH43_9PLEO|nr:uncharacterized protein N0V89_008178 [Didymosphaeria variabile]KAJ4349562.1 hypothetical protein N0V89_008178 [Didymosphaeria variabile]